MQDSEKLAGVVARWVWGLEGGTKTDRLSLHFHRKLTEEYTAVRDMYVKVHEHLRDRLRDCRRL